MTRIASWNVNGLRSVIKKGGLEIFLKTYDPDIVCLQEVKALPHEADIPANYPYAFWHPAERKGYAGSLIFSKKSPIKSWQGMRDVSKDNEGRVVTIECVDWYLVNAYAVNSQRGLPRLPYRLQWDEWFHAYLQNLACTKPVIVCGDLNVAHTELDIANPKGNLRNSGFTLEERSSFSKLLNSGFVDTFRLFCKEGKHYTWWSRMPGVRERNIGWRIDYFLVSTALVPHIQSCRHAPEILGSDHCPVLFEIY
jgi:exodeoxyribonuclease-3